MVECGSMKSNAESSRLGSGFGSRCMSRPSDQEYDDRSKLVSEHPPGLADMKMGTKQTEKNVQEATEKMQDLGEYISILKDDVAGLDKAAKEEIAEIETIAPPAKTRMISSLRKFLTEQQEEYFKFHKDVCVLTKEKDDLTKEITKCFERVSQLEESLGISHS